MKAPTKAAIAVIAGALTAFPICMYAVKNLGAKADANIAYNAPLSPSPAAVAAEPVTVVINRLPEPKPQPQPKPTLRSKTLLFVKAIVTGYTGFDKRCDGKWWKFNRTSTGRNAKLTRGVAVDPRAIPYGTRVIIPNVGTFSADDTGGKMRQDWRKRGIIHIDVRFPTFREAKNWGVKKREIGLYRR